ncbi:MAG: thioredoxin family protein [Hyphomicrobiaceae bacterium]
MTISRRAFLGTSLAGAVVGSGAMHPTSGRAAEATAGEPVRGDDGLYKQEWFIDSFLDLKDDLAEAASAGKHFVVLFEQNGCPYCREMHRVNLTKPEIKNYITANFSVLQLDLWGSRRVTDFDGKEMGERELAQRWRITGTPTLVFFPNDPAKVADKSGREVEAWRLLGYWKPFHFLSTFVYVRGGHYENQHFQRFLQARADELRAQGKNVELW